MQTLFFLLKIKPALRKDDLIFQSILAACGNRKSLLITGMIIATLGSVISLFTYFYAWRVLQTALSHYPQRVHWADISTLAIYAVATAIIGLLLYTLELMNTHLAAFRAEYTLRSRAYKALQEVPLGYYSQHTSGTVRKEIDDNISFTHNLIAHQSADIASSIGVLLVSLPLLF